MVVGVLPQLSGRVVEVPTRPSLAAVLREHRLHPPGSPGEGGGRAQRSPGPVRTSL